MADSADLIVLGGYYGKNQHGGMVSVFLMGLYDTNAQTFKTVCKAGNGLDEAQLEKYQKTLIPTMTKIERNFDKVPKWLTINRPVVPDWIVKDPRTAPVWEISGAEFSNSDRHTADGISIRFPRITRIRDDKSFESATTLEELKALCKKDTSRFNVSSKRKREESTSESEPPPKKPKVGGQTQRSLPAFFNKCTKDTVKAPPPPVERIEKKSEEQTKQKIFKQKKPHENGIQYVQGDIFELSSVTEETKFIVRAIDETKHSDDDLPRIVAMWPEVGAELDKWIAPQLGTVQLCKVSSMVAGKLYVCFVVCKKGKGKSSDPPVVKKSFISALNEVRALASHKHATVHLAKFSASSLAKMDWEAAEVAINQCLVSRGVNVFVYSPEPLQQPQDEPMPDAAPVAIDTGADTEPDSAHGELLGAETESDEELHKKAREIEEGPLFALNIVVPSASSLAQKVKGKLQSMGAKYFWVLFQFNYYRIQDQWKAYGADESTHYIFFEGDTGYNHVLRLGGAVVLPKWVDECQRTWKKVDEKPFQINNNNQQVTQILPTSPVKVQHDLPNVFHGLIFCFDHVSNEDQLWRYITAYGGKIQPLGDATTHVVTTNKRPEIVSPQWVWDCVNTGTIVLS